MSDAKEFFMKKARYAVFEAAGGAAFEFSGGPRFRY
jgi:hypothetical protein